MRSAAYVSRFLPLEVPDIRDALVEGKAGATIVRKGVAALRETLESSNDRSGIWLDSASPSSCGLYKILPRKTAVVWGIAVRMSQSKTNWESTWKQFPCISRREVRLTMERKKSALAVFALCRSSA